MRGWKNLRKKVVVNMTIGELLDSIKSLDLVLPEFQREYVWEKEQPRQLLVSAAITYTS